MSESPTTVDFEDKDLVLPCQPTQVAPTVRVGLAVFAIRRRDGSVLVGKRKGSHGAGTYQMPGGHLDYLESFESCAAREVFEETGLKLDPQTISFLTTTNDPMPEENTHYVTIFMRGELVDDEPLPQTLEPEKCEFWKFTSFEDLVTLKPLFKPLENLTATRPDFHPLTWTSQA